MEKNGKGREYYTDGDLKFEGEYLNGKKMEKEKNIFIVMAHYNFFINHILMMDILMMIINILKLVF